jgi:RNA-binding protein
MSKASPLSQAQKKQFRTIGHQLNPIVTLGDSGLSANVKKELNRALEDHELIKIKVPAAERTEKQKLIDSICQSGQCELIQRVGNVALLYRAAKKPNPKLSNIIKAQNS